MRSRKELNYFMYHVQSRDFRRLFCFVYNKDNNLHSLQPFQMAAALRLELSSNQPATSFSN